MDDRNIEVEKRTVQKHSDSSKVGVALIKYTAYVLIFFGFLYFLVKFVLPIF